MTPTTSRHTVTATATAQAAVTSGMPSRPVRIAVISCSVREARMSQSIADWACTALLQRRVVEVERIDLAKITLPEDRLLSPGGGPRTEVGTRIATADAFVFVTPEYNHSYPASLKRLIDLHFTE